MRIAIGGIMHESNSFSSVPTDLEDFNIQRSDDLITHWQHAHHEVGGFIEGAATFGYDAVPLMMANATPGGSVTRRAFEALVGELIELLQAAGDVDGLLLALHGAMVAEVDRDGDGAILKRLRDVTGPDFPIVVTHDLHANVAQQVIDHCTALVIYKTYPHLDHRERGVQAAEIMARTVRGEVKPTQVMVKPPMLLNIVCQYTNAEPMRTIMQAVRKVEQQPGILAASLAEGYQYADVNEVGPAIVIVTDDDTDLAASQAEHINTMLWDSRDQLEFDLPEAAEAVKLARESAGSPVVLVEMGDNIGGGSAGDSTIILHELLAQKAENWLVVLADPEAVQACVAAGIDATITLEVGGKTDDLHGQPVQVSGRVKSLHDGRYIETQPRHGGQRYHDQGLTAVLEIAASTPETASYVVLTTRRQAPMSLHQIISLGIQPERKHILVVKAAIAYRAAYEPIAGRIIEVDTPGLTAVNPARFTFEHVQRDLWGLV